jgi:hypothetical protein
MSLALIKILRVAVAMCWECLLVCFRTWVEWWKAMTMPFPPSQPRCLRSGDGGPLVALIHTEDSQTRWHWVRVASPTVSFTCHPQHTLTQWPVPLAVPASPCVPLCNADPICGCQIGSNCPICMPNRTSCVLLVSVMTGNLWRRRAGGWWQSGAPTEARPSYSCRVASRSCSPTRSRPSPR